MAKKSNTSDASKNKIKAIIYGASGVGKTTLAKTLKGKTLLISAEAGTLCLQDFDIDTLEVALNDDGSLIPEHERMSSWGSAMSYLQTEECQKIYKNIYVDSLTEFSQNAVAALQREFPDRKDALVLYGELSRRTKAFVRTVRDLPFYNIFFTALSENEKDEVGRVYKTMSMIGKVSQLLPGYFDLVLYMRIAENKEGISERQLVSLGSEQFVAKDRSSRLSPIEPADLGIIMEKITNTKRGK